MNRNSSDNSTDNNAEKIVDLYTDGACKGNPGWGGWAC